MLSDVERNGGVALVDFGGGVTSVSVFQGGILRHYASIPFGGEAITGDIEMECALPADLAEKIKVRFGACQPDKLGGLSEKVLQIRLTDPFTEIPVRYISEIIDSRCREIVEAVLFYIEESGYANSLRSGIVVTGGSAELTNFVSLFKEMSGYKVRTGYPRRLFSSSVGLEVFSPSAAAVMGMILCAKDDALLDCAKDETLMDSATETTQTEAVSDSDTTERPGLLHLVWNTIEETALKVYDYIND